LLGRLTTWEPERVASVALRQALRGRAVIIPGLINRVIRALGSVAPRWLVVRVIGSRWRKAELAPRDGTPVYIAEGT
jgi:short-subunit dehydrogenase